jgi:hypothetical protein
MKMAYNPIGNLNEEKLVVHFFADRNGNEQGPYDAGCAAFVTAQTGAEALPDNWQEGDECIACGEIIHR